MVLSGECPLTYNKHGREVDREKVICRRDQTHSVSLFITVCCPQNLTWSGELINRSDGGIVISISPYILKMHLFSPD